MEPDNSSIRIENFRNWYISKQQIYEEVGEYVLKKIKTYLKEQKFNLAYSNARAKTVESVYEKAKKQIKKGEEYVLKYSDPKTQIMDFAGVRLVVYLPSEVQVVEKAVKCLFGDNIRNEDSENKVNRLGEDKVGYLSVHYVVVLNPTEREYLRLNGLKCEIQIRTVLQDAWAQIFHDRVYKNSAVTDKESNLSRTVNLLSGTLELIDNHINQIVIHLDNKNGNLSAKSYQELLNENISETALIKYCSLLLQGKVEKFYSYNQIFELLMAFGINTIRELDYHVNSGFIQELQATNISLTIDRLIRYILIISDYEKFFECIDKSHIFTINRDTYELLDKFISMYDVCNKYDFIKKDEGI